MCTQTGISTVAKFLFKELEKRFVYVLDPSSPIFNAVYLAATLLNPACRSYLLQLKSTLPKTFLKSMMSSRDDMIDTNEVNTHLQSEENEPPPKLFTHLNFVCDMREQEEKSTRHSQNWR